MVAWNTNGVPTVCGSLTRAPFRPGSCRAVTMFHVLEHLFDPASYLDAARELLAPDGRCLIYAGRPFGCRTHFCAAAGGPYARREVIDLIHRLEDLDAVRLLARRHNVALPGPAAVELGLDFRDIDASLAQKAGKPDLGKRGYGCMQREDDFADVVEQAGEVEPTELFLGAAQITS